ncbi:MAG: glycosyltransferase, partial [Faecalibacterium sp.]|nr:glycosyltransferase [Faecalibacterium sp.]
GDYVVMPNGVDLPCERVSNEAIAQATAGYDLPEELPVYLFVGRMLWYKGQRIILDALQQVHRQGQDFRMVFIGDGEDRAEIQAYAEQLGLGEKCIFTGIIPSRETLRAWYCRAHLFLFPSTYDTNGLVVREAAACSLAAVLVRGSCAAEDVTDGQNGFLIEENADSLAACLTALHNDLNRMRTVGRAAADELYISWESAVQRARQRYEIVIERYQNGDYKRRLRPVEGILKANGELMDTLGSLVSLRQKIEQFGKERYRDLPPFQFLNYFNK